ncbi:hypothetical protein CLOM_g22012 [Closterium sp. NIES-68]|nr:hypothetical protein CLOM_g22012 [Closterium sp. NIES-68]
MNERGGDANGRGAVPEKTSEPPPSKVEALDGSNYEEWSGRMRSAFKRYKLLKIAVGEEKMPEEGEERERWIEKSTVLFDLILQSVNKEMFEHIKDLVEADDSGPRAWKLLRDVIQPNTLPMVIVLEKELAAISMRPGDDVKPVLDKIKDTYARMAAAGSSVSQLQQCTKIISVLDNSWDNLIPTLNSQQDQWTPEWLRQQILQEDFRRRHVGGGCTSHMTPRADLLDEVKPPGKIKYVAAASGALLPVIGVGNAKVKGANGELVGLGNVLLVEGLSANLLSVRRLQKSKAEVTFGPTSCRAKLGKKASSRSGEADWETWHERLCHVNFPMLQKLVKDGSLKGLETREEALNGPNGEKWKASEDEEFGSLIENETWDLCDLPPGKKAITSKMIYRHKYGPEGELTRYKSRLVARGFQQTKGKDYDEVFAPVGKGTTLRVLLAIAALLGWKIRQMDIVTAFLNGIILEEVYMKQPEGLDDGSGRVCRLKKAIYGLKQAPRAWYHKLEEALLAGGFKKSECDPSLFLLQEKDEILMLLVYVDDILLFSASTALLDSAEQMLEMQFKCSKMGEVKYYLGMHVERDVEKGVLRLHQRKYCEGLAEKYGLQDGGKPATPLPSGFTVEPCADEEVKEPTVIFCDNESAVKLAKNACLHGLTKHIRPKWHWVRRLLDKEVRLEIVKTHQQAADIFTKRLAEADHWKGMKLAGMSVH